MRSISFIAFGRMSVFAVVALAAFGSATAADALANAGAAATNSTDASDLTEIIVTARRQAENLQDVPQTVVPLPAEELSNLEIRQLSDISTIVPGLTLTPGNFTQVQLRGVAFNNLTNGDSTIAFYLNDSDLSPAVVEQGLFDIGQVEVLKGPQGTNRGVSAPSGAITITTHLPDLSQIGGYVDGALGTQATRSIEGAFNMPLIKDVLAVRVAGLRLEDNNGDVVSIHNPTEPRHLTESERISIRLAPTDSFDANVMWQHLEGTITSFSQVFGIGDNNALNPPIAPDQRLSVQNGPNTEKDVYNIVTGNMHYSEWGHTLTYTGNYVFANTSHTSGTDDVPDLLPGLPTTAFVTTTNGLGTEQTSQELRISSNPSKDHLVDYTAGAYYRRLRQFGASDFAPQLLPGAFGGNLASPDIAAYNPAYALAVAVRVPFLYREVSFFGNATLHLGESTDLTAGIRALHSNFEGHSTLNTTPALAAVALPSSLCSAFGGQFGATYAGLCNFPVASRLVSDVSANIPSNRILWSAQLAHHFSPDLMSYINIGTSFLRPTSTIGLQGPFASSSDPLLRQLAFHPPQTSTGYEAGFKWDFLDKRGLIDIAGFYQTFKNFQVLASADFLNTAVTPSSLSSFSFPTSVDAHVYGFDADVAFKILRGWNVDLLASYANGSGSGSVPCTTLNSAGTPVFNTDGIISFCPGAAQVSHNPIWNASLQSAYERPLFGGVDGFVRGQVTYYPRNNRVSLFYSADSYAIANFYLGVHSHDGTWETSFYVKNAFNDATVIGRSDQLLFDSGISSFPTLNRTSGYYSAQLPPPRVFGVDLRYAFGSR